MITIADITLAMLRAELALPAPERGGALFGPAQQPLVTHFIADPSAKTTPTSYTPSDWLIREVPRIEMTTGLQFKGIIHSHPYGAVRPSCADERAMAAYFRRNPQVGDALLPIVQPAPSGDPNGAADFVYWYRACRQNPCHARTQGSGRREPPIGVQRIGSHVLPLARSLEQVCAGLRLQGMSFVISDRLETLQIGGGVHPGLSARDAQDRELHFFVPLGYPDLAPIVLAGSSADGMVSIPVRWNGIVCGLASLDEVVHALVEFWQRGRHGLGSRAADPAVCAARAHPATAIPALQPPPDAGGSSCAESPSRAAAGSPGSDEPLPVASLIQ